MPEKRSAAQDADLPRHRCPRIMIHVDDDDRGYFPTRSGRAFPYAPTVDWRQCRPIIGNNHISIEKVSVGWRAHHAGTAAATGPTALIAAMRTRLKMKHGDKVEVNES